MSRQITVAGIIGLGLSALLFAVSFYNLAAGSLRVSWMAGFSSAAVAYVTILVIGTLGAMRGPE